VVSEVLETGANDVLVVKPCEGSLDSQERLVPYVIDHYVTKVDLVEQVIHVRWDPEF
jgi:16S rRNA processing protein RimM